jgi:hypothetical protein
VAHGGAGRGALPVCQPHALCQGGLLLGQCWAVLLPCLVILSPSKKQHAVANTCNLALCIRGVPRACTAAARQGPRGTVCCCLASAGAGT